MLCFLFFFQKSGHFEHIDDLGKVAGISLSVLRKNSANLTCSKRQLRALGRKKPVRHTDKRFASVFHYINYSVLFVKVKVLQECSISTLLCTESAVAVDY